ncbi:hypothetical protein GCM10009550_46260 [Actinocorallia libanotica]|uniref:Uncharacterized protein n=1 Tax=Actinocorallia libanotica TaxID=46162 RepID=A0ABP4C0U2_9ACTN
MAANAARIRERCRTEGEGVVMGAPRLVPEVIAPLSGGASAINVVSPVTRQAVAISCHRPGANQRSLL